MPIYSMTITVCCLFLTATIFADDAHSAEYTDELIIPQVETLVQTAGYIAIEMTPAYMQSQIHPDEGYSRYFLAPIHTLEFERISADEFSSFRAKSDDVTNLRSGRARQSNDSRHCYSVVTGTEPCREYSYDVEKIDFIGHSVPINLECFSSVADAVMLEDEIWVLTYEQGGHGAYGSEGLIVFDLEGAERARVETGHLALLAMVKVQGLDGMWVFSTDRIMWVGDGHEIRNTWWPVHQFDGSTGRPDVALVESETPVLTDPLAVFAYTLGEPFYQDFYRSIAGVTYKRDQSLLYRYFMTGPSYSAMLPDELNVLIPEAEPTHPWRKFMCMLNDSKAAELCGLELDQWPVNADQ